MRRLAVLLVLFGCAHSKPAPPTKKPLLTLTCSGVSHALYIKPAEVFLVGRLSREADLSGFECAVVEWHLGKEGNAQRMTSDCSISRVFERWQVFHYYGEHRPALYLRSPEDGKVLAWAECRVTIQPPLQ